MRGKKLFMICLTACLLAFACSGCAELLGTLEQNINEYTASEDEVEYTEDYYDRLFFGDVISDEVVRENIFAALTEVNINTEFIKEFKRIEDGSGTEKFGFIYRENSFTVTLDPDYTVYSVKIGEDGEDIYLKGYESYDVDDYMVTESIVNGFNRMNINVVETAFDYPEIYEFADDWTFKHEKDFYYLTGTVFIGEAKEEHFLDIVYYYEEAENTMYWYSIHVDGNELLLDKVFEEPVITEREPLSGE